jgi:GxxExxY protein
MINEQYKYSELTGKIIGCAMEVHKQLGNGFQEVIYQRALDIEFSTNDIDSSREYEMPIYYKQEQIGTRRVDFLIDDVVSVELKALTKLEDVHLAQAINYLEAYDLEIGLLINFGAKSLEFKRLVNKKFNQQNQGNPKVQNQGNPKITKIKGSDK